LLNIDIGCSKAALRPNPAELRPELGFRKTDKNCTLYTEFSKNEKKIEKPKKTI